MQEFPANSQKAKATANEAPREQVKQVTPVTTATTSGRKKRGLGRKFKDAFISGSPKAAAVSMVEDVVVPSIRETIHEALRTGLDSLILGERPRGRPRAAAWSPQQPPSGSVSYPYDAVSRPTRAAAPQQRSMSQKARASHDFRDLIIPTREAANEVLDQLYETVSREGVVSVAHLYALTGIKVEHTDMKWGWTNLQGSRVRPLRQGGCLLDLPAPEPLV